MFRVMIMLQYMCIHINFYNEEVLQYSCYIVTFGVMIMLQHIGICSNVYNEEKSQYNCERILLNLPYCNSKIDSYNMIIISDVSLNIGTHRPQCRIGFKIVPK